jgi:hypothetical protein
MTDHLSEDDLVLHFYGEIDHAEQSRVMSHLESCAECRLAKDQLARVMALVDAAAPIEAPDGFERVTWARLEPKLDEPVRGSAWKLYDLVFGRTAREGGWFPQWALAGGVAALLVAAFWAGRISSVMPAPPSSANSVASVEPQRVLQAAVGDHLDRTQMMLVELVNAETDHADVLASEQSRAADLVAANRVIKASALQSGDRQIVDVLEDLERVLLEIANAPADATSKEITDLQSRITTEDLLFRLRVIALEMRQRNQDRPTDDPNLRRTPRS